MMAGVEEWTVTIPGTPRPQGSAKWVVDHRRLCCVPKKDPTEEAHRARMVTLLRHEWARTGQREPLAGPVEVRALFCLPRKKSHHTARGALTKSAPLLHTYTPDLDKLQRLAGDALTQARVIGDDAQICVWAAEKRWLPYGTEGFTRLTLRTVDVLDQHTREEPPQ